MADSTSDVFSGSIATRMQWARVDTQENGSITNRNVVSATYSIGDGSGTGAADVVWADSRTIPAESIDAIDLLSLTQTTLGVSVPCTIRQLRAVRIVNAETEPGMSIRVGADATGETYAFEVGPGSEMLSINNADAWPVDAANSVLRIANINTDPVSYSIVLIGTSVEAE
jgi:hypothetical protein